MFILLTPADLRSLRDAQVVPDSLLDRVAELMISPSVDAPSGQSALQPPPVMILQSGDGVSVYTLTGLTHGSIIHEEPWECPTDYGAMTHYRLFELQTRRLVYRVLVPLGLPEPAHA